jgi:hypothetical protein
MADTEQAKAEIHFALSQLAAQNRHYELEHLTCALARMTMVKVSKVEKISEPREDQQAARDLRTAASLTDRIRPDLSSLEPCCGDK